MTVSVSLTSRAPDATDWPQPWTRHERWPRLQPEPWTPRRPGRAVTACLRPEGVMELIRWAGPKEAFEAARELFREPCGPDCVGQHMVTWTDTERVHVRSIGGVPKPTSLATQVIQAYPICHRPEHHHARR